MKDITELAQSVGYPMLSFMGQPYVSPELRRLVTAAVEQEREACAQVVEAVEPSPNPIINMTNRLAAAAIRARSNT